MKLGYQEKNQGRSSGSRVAFFHPDTGMLIRLHKPHPDPTVKRYVIDAVIEALKRNGEI